jgi:hypothetical protein
MHTVLTEIERVAERCTNAASSVRELLRKAPHGNTPEAVMDCAREAERAFRQLCDETLPQLDAIAVIDTDSRLRSRLERLHRIAVSQPANLARDHLTAQAKAAYGPAMQAPPVRELIGVMSDCVEGLFCAVELMDAAEQVQYLARYLRTKHALSGSGSVADKIQLRDVIVGSNFTTNVTGSTIGAVAVGDHATTSGTVNVHHGPLTQAQHEERIKRAKKALVEDEDKLDELVHEALSQFLTLARKIRVEQQSLVDTQARMKATLDEVWSARVARGMKQQTLPNTLQIVKTLMENPTMVKVTQKLTGV